MDAPTSSPAPDAALAAERQDRLRQAAPAVQHEVNNALMVLASNLELLGRSAAEGAPRRQVDRCVEAMRRLEATVRGFLDAARRPASDPAEVPPSVVVQAALPLLRVALGARHGLEAELAEGAWAARLDRARLDLALLALVREASGRMPPGARIGLGVANRAETREVALSLRLPEGSEPSAAVLALLEAAATATGGRLERGPVLAWPRAGGAG